MNDLKKLWGKTKNSMRENEEELVRSFKRMRKKRHPLQYEAVFSESKEEVKNSISKAEKLVLRIKEHLKIKPTQRLLF